MKLLFLKFTLIFVLAVSLRFVELCRDVILSTERAKILPNIRVLYNALYLHLPMSMAAIGIMCDRLIDNNPKNPVSLSILVIFILTIAGCISRGIISRSEPEVFSLYDRDWTSGILIPNILGLSALISALFQIS